jgi:hypothetical protein
MSEIDPIDPSQKSFSKVDLPPEFEYEGQLLVVTEKNIREIQTALEEKLSHNPKVNYLNEPIEPDPDDDDTHEDPDDADENFNAQLIRNERNGELYFEGEGDEATSIRTRPFGINSEVMFRSDELTSQFVWWSGERVHTITFLPPEPANS